MKLALADNWRQLHTRGVVIFSAACGAITAFGPSLIDAWNSVPPDLKAALPEGTARYVSTIAFVLMIVIRYTTIRHDSKPDGENHEQL